MLKKVLYITIPLIAVGAIVFFFVGDGSAKKEDILKTVPVKKGTIIDKALAVGRIQPRHEISVKSKVGGLVKKIYADVGDKVTIGDPLFDIAPDPTPIEYADAKRQVELAQVTFDNLKREFDRATTLSQKGLISNQEFDTRQAAYDEAELRLKLSREKLALTETGRTQIANRQVDNVIKSTITGTVLSRLVQVGDPVVPLTSYQAGTELMTLAAMDDLMFKGTVDEIDVGKLREGMSAEIEIGALPTTKVSAQLSRISPKAHKEEGSTLFDVEMSITSISQGNLRAGYSANGNVVINKKEDILIAPERLVKMTDSSSTVEIKDSMGVVTPRVVVTGLSDGVNIEVKEGLKEGELLVERPPKEIKGE